MAALVGIVVVRRGRNLGQDPVCPNPDCARPVDNGWIRCKFCSMPLHLSGALAQLVSLDDKLTHTWPITRSLTEIGRLKVNHIALDVDTVGRRHASLQLKDGRFYINDQGSENTVLLNDQETHSAQLTDGDQLDLGGLKFRFEINPEVLALGSTEDKQD